MYLLNYLKLLQRINTFYMFLFQHTSSTRQCLHRHETGQCLVSFWNV